MPARSEVNATSSPAGDQTGRRSLSGEVLKRVLTPRARIVHPHVPVRALRCRNSHQPAIRGKRGGADQLLSLADLSRFLAATVQPTQLLLPRAGTVEVDQRLIGRNRGAAAVLGDGEGLPSS